MVGPLGPEPSSRDPSQIVVDGSHQPAVGLPIALSPRNEQRGYIICQESPDCPVGPDSTAPPPGRPVYCRDVRDVSRFSTRLRFC